MPRKLTKKSLTKRLDKLCSDIIRKGVCAKCGESQYDKLQCAHIYTRKWRSVRWSFINLVCLCASCHARFHDKPIEFGEFVKEYLGEIKYQELKNQANSIKKWNLDEMISLYNVFLKNNKYEIF